MKEVLEKAVQLIHSGRLNNETQVKQSIIVPILRALNWDDSDPHECVLVYSVPHYSGRVDYALCDAAGSAKVFIEAKRLGASDERGEAQVFQYAYGQGVPLLILTDGNIWNFYLSMAEGLPDERRFYHMKLNGDEQKLSEYAADFQRYLGKSRVLSGQAASDAGLLHSSNRAKQKAKAAISKAWKNLLKNPEAGLRELLLNTVANESGQQADVDDIDAFLLMQPTAADTPAPVHRPTFRPPSASPKPPRQLPTSSSTDRKIVGYILDGKEIHVGSARRTLKEILIAFHQRDAGFLERLAVKKTPPRQIVAQKQMSRSWEDNSWELVDGWRMYNNLKTQHSCDCIKIACEVAGITFGSQLQLIER